MKYRKEIDGLRALAVLPVIFYHVGFQKFGGGFVGVDVFFVISGYLITILILAEKQEGTFTIANFYERRARRILPALFVVMFACLPFVWFLMLPTAMKEFSHSMFAVLAFASNILFWKTSGYFDTAAELKPLLHTWSLAVEEQYYLFFPVFILLTWRLGASWIVKILGVVAIISLTLADWGALNKSIATFYLLPTRGWELLIGVFIAFYLFNKEKDAVEGSPSKTDQLISIIGLLLIAYAVFSFDKHTPFPSLYALIPTIGAALIIIFAIPQTFVGRMLCSKLLVGIGLISYSAYLWHQPIIAFIRIIFGELSTNWAIMSILFILLLSFFSWKYIEKPFRRKDFINGKMLRVFFVVSLCSLVGSGIILERNASALLNKVTPIISGESQGIDACFLTDEGVEALDKKKCAIAGDEAHLRVLLLGDSHASSLYPGLKDYLSDKDISLSMITAAFCLPLVDEFPPNKSQSATNRCSLINKKIHEVLTKQRFNLIVVSSYILEWGFRENLQWTYPGYYEDYLTQIKKLSFFNNIMIIGQFPIWPSGLPNVMANEIRGGEALEKLSMYSKNGLDPMIFQVDENVSKAMKNINVGYVSVIKGMCIATSCLRYILTDGSPQLLAFDYGHLSLYGSKYVASQIVGPNIVQYLGQR